MAHDGKGWLVAIDPGLNHAGVAIFYDGVLRRTRTVKSYNPRPDPKGWQGVARAVDEYVRADEAVSEFDLAYEMPQIIKGWQKGDRNSLLQLSCALGAIADRLGPLTLEVTEVLPSVWTRSKEKTVNHPKMWRRLSELERVAMADSFGVAPHLLAQFIEYGDEGSLEHAMDATCVGLFALGRFAKWAV